MTTDRSIKVSWEAPTVNDCGPIADVLEVAGFAPPERREFLTDTLPIDDDLLPVLISLWDSQPTAARRSALPSWLRRRHNDGAALTIGIPGDAGASCWLGPRLAWWPQGIPRGRFVGLASSRLGRPLEAKQAWFAMLRAACAQTDASEDILVTAAATATAKFVVRAAELFDRRLLCIETASSDSLAPERWLKSLAQSARSGFNRLQSRVLISPAIVPTTGCGQDTAQAPIRDQALIAMSQRLLVFHVRRNGHILDLLSRRLSDGRWPPPSTLVALGEGLTDRVTAATLMDQGAVGWLVAPPPPTRRTNRTTTPLALSPGGPPGRIEVPPAENWEFLTHCTRSAHGPWPGQDEEQYLDELILGQPSADHSAAAALMRIVDERRLAASSEGIRGGFPTVSYSAVPLAQLGSLRIFRPHRGRWDFEPYGICIRKSWLQQHQVRPVCYGNDESWQALDAADQPYYQRHQSITRRTGHIIDWTVEREWRTIGDLDLSSLGADDAFVFVPTEADATRLARRCPWPIAVVNEW